MRSFVRFSASVALVAFAATAATAGSPGTAAADASTPSVSQVLQRNGQPWLFTGKSRFASPRAAVNAVMPKAAGLSLVELRSAKFGDGDQIVRFGQTFRGIPVVNRGATVRTAANGETLMTAVDLAADLPATTSPTTTASAAAKIAAATEKDAHLVIWTMRDGSTRLAWAVVPQMPVGMPTAPRTIVDAQTGRVLERRNMAVFANAQVYRFNPTKTPTLETTALTLTPSDTHLTNEFVVAKNCIDHKRVATVNLGGFSLPMHTCDLDQTATADGSGNFIYTPHDDAGSAEARTDTFSEVSMYYHASKAYTFFRTLQGDMTAQVIVDKPLPVVANLQTPPGILAGNVTKASDPNTPLDTFSNAFFAPAAGGLGEIFQQLYNVPSSGALWFGQGPQRDYAYDGDVVYHEFTHAVVDDTLQLGAWHLDEYGAVDSPGAMNEGLADYFSSAITGDPDVGEYASKDLSQNLDVIRTLANTDKCPDGVVGEVHADSTLFSGGLWSARASLPEADRSKFDGALYKAMRANPGHGDVGYEDVANLFLATLKTDYPAGATALEAEMKTRGVLPGCTRMLEGNGGVLKPTKQDLNGWWSTPGIQSVGTDGIAPGLFQVHQKLDKAKTITVGIDIRGTSGSSNPLGGQQTPFAPALVVKFGDHIKWDLVKNTNDGKTADMKKGANDRYTLDVDVPEGATDVYVQVANKGDSDGYFSNLRVDAFADPNATPPAPPATETPGDTTPATTTTESGCAVGPDSSHTSTGLGIFLGLAGVLALGKRRQKRA